MTGLQLSNNKGYFNGDILDLTLLLLLIRIHMRLRSAIKASKEATARHLTYNGEYFHYLGLRPIQTDSRISDTQSTIPQQLLSGQPDCQQQDQGINSHEDNMETEIVQKNHSLTKNNQPEQPTDVLSSSSSSYYEDALDIELDSSNQMFDLTPDELDGHRLKNSTIHQFMQSDSVENESDSADNESDSSVEDILVDILGSKNEQSTAILNQNPSANQEIIEILDTDSDTSDDEPDLELEGEEYEPRSNYARHSCLLEPKTRICASVSRN